MSTLKFNFEAMLIKDWVCLQCFQQDALEFEIIAFIKPEMTSKIVAIALKCNSFALSFKLNLTLTRFIIQNGSKNTKNCFHRA